MAPINSEGFLYVYRQTYEWHTPPFLYKHIIISNKIGVVFTDVSCSSFYMLVFFSEKVLFLLIYLEVEVQNDLQILNVSDVRLSSWTMPRSIDTFHRSRYRTTTGCAHNTNYRGRMYTFVYFVEISVHAKHKTCIVFSSDVLIPTYAHSYVFFAHTSKSSIQAHVHNPLAKPPTLIGNPNMKL